MDITVTAAVGLICTVIGCVIGVVGYARLKKKDAEVNGEAKGVIASDIGYIKAGVDDLKRENRETRHDVSGLTERVTRCEESCKQAHHRIDELKGEN